MRKSTLIVFLLIGVSLWENVKSQTLTQSFLLDFGCNDVTNGDITTSPDGNGNYWNNIYLSGIGNINSTNFPAITLKNASGNETTLGFSFVSGSFYLTGKQTANGGLLSPVASNFGTNAELAIATATEDYGFTSATTPASAPVIKFTGLDQTKIYVFKVFASRSGTTTRTSQYTIQGYGTAVVGTLNSSTAGTGTNLGNVYVSSGITPSTSGEISLATISLVASNNAYINCMKLEEYYYPVTTNSVTGITQTSATGNGIVINTGSSATTSSGVCWSTTSGGETVSGNHTTDGPTGSSVPLSITSSMTGLAAGQTYYVKAYAANSTITLYGNEVSFTTLAGISTSLMSSVAQTTATCGGTITSAGAYTQKGVCWSESANPTISDNKTTDGSGSGNTSFSSSLTGLSANKTYHVRAYVTNASGTSYGNDIQFTTPLTLISSGNSSSFSLNSTSKITIPAGIQMTIDNNTNVKTIQVNSGGQLTLNSGQTLSVDSIVLQSDANGTASFVDQNVTNQLTVTSGSIAQQYLSGPRNWYISSPVSNAMVPQTGYTFYSRSESTASWITMNKDSVLKPGHGYIANLASGPATYSFNGAFNSGLISVELSKTTGVDKAGFNLIGNPYPSNYTVTKSSTDAANALNTIWYRTATWDSDLNKYVFTFQTCLINADGSFIGTPTNTTNIIPPMQAFWVRTNVDGSVYSFDNLHRVQQSSNSFKAPSKSDVGNELLRLQISNDKYSDETVLYANPNATQGLDEYDAIKMSNNNIDVPEIYSVENVREEQLAINGISGFTPNMEIPLGYRTQKAGTFKIKAIEIPTIGSDVTVVLKDHSSNYPVEIELTQNASYEFYTSESTGDTSRFSIVFKTSSISTDLNSNFENNFAVYGVQNKIYINKTSSSQIQISLYDIAGQLIGEDRILASGYVLKKAFSPGVYFIVASNGKTKKTFKVIIH